MTAKINTYEDLLIEKQRLTVLLQAQKEIVRQDIDEIKESLGPVRSAISMINKLTTRDSGNWLLNTAANKVIDLIVKKLILSKAGWLTRLTVPFFMKNFSSHVIADHKDEIMGKIFSWVKNKFSSNGKANYEEEEEYEPPIK